MEISKKSQGGSLIVEITGKVDTNTSVQFREEVADRLEGVKNLVLDMKNTTYLSSAGMRVLLACQKTMDENGSMTIRNIGPDILRLLKATGMLELLHVDETPRQK